LCEQNLKGTTMPTTNLFVDERDTKDRTDDQIIEEVMLSFFTPDRPGAGTDATVCLQIGPKKYFVGDKASMSTTSLGVSVNVGGVGISMSTASAVQGSDKDHFEKGQYDTFFLNQINLPLTDLRQAAIRLSHDGRGLASDWYAGRFEMFLRFVGENAFKTYKFWPEAGWVTAKDIVLLQQGLA
jgi:hypothetical protein